MKKAYFIFPIFLLCFGFIGCFPILWCDVDSDSAPLSGTAEIVLNTKQEVYRIDENAEVLIKYFDLENTYNKILLRIDVELYDSYKGKYISSDNLILNRENSEANLANEVFEFFSGNTSQIQIEEKLYIRAKTEGQYRVVFYILGSKKDSDKADYCSEYFYIKFQ